MSGRLVQGIDVPVSIGSLRVAEAYVAAMHVVLDAIPIEAVIRLANLIFSVTLSGNTVYVFGNGGSAATADHIACDLTKNTRVPGAPFVRCVSLASTVTTTTALANDDGYVGVFAEALRMYGRRGDLALAISTSGDSPNVVEALVAARETGIHSAALLGFQGGKAMAFVELPIVVRNKSVPHLEDAHNVINHVLAACVRELLASLVAEKQPSRPHCLGGDDGDVRFKGGSKLEQHHRNQDSPRP
jgi:D-sedoheptulose 7-phosphate isomerase